MKHLKQFKGLQCKAGQTGFSDCPNYNKRSWKTYDEQTNMETAVRWHFK